MIERIWLMSVYATILIVLVLGIRCLLKQYSKSYCYSLWLLVLIRLLCPFFITSSFAVHPYVQETVSKVAMIQEQVQEQSSQSYKQEALQTELYPETHGFTRVQIIEAMKMLWLFGVIITGSYFFLQYRNIRKKIQTAIKEEEKIWLSDQIASPFVFGLLHPRAYLPYGMQGMERDYIIQHEMMHIRHKDAWIRAAGTLAVCLHWWNPAVWYGISKVYQDMEMFCDESVLKSASGRERKEYANILLLYSIKNSGMKLAMAFGASNTERRIKHICKRRKREYSVTAAITISMVALAVLFGTLPNKIVEGSSLPTRLLERPIEFAGGDKAFQETVDCSAEEARTFLTKFYNAVSKNQRQEVASLMSYPRTLQAGNELIELHDADDFVKHYDGIITDKFKEKLKVWMENEINYTYLGMYLNEGEVWILLGEHGWFLNSIDNAEGQSIHYKSSIS